MQRRRSDGEYLCWTSADLPHHFPPLRGVLTPIPHEGELAPDFTATTDAGEQLALSSLRGRPVVLFFYPKDDTSG
jgi:hypothetical protein